MRTIQTLPSIVLLLAATAATAQPRPSIPAVVLTHMNSLDARCTAAGGRPAGGRYVFGQDFTGDGRIDYLLSEGDYACSGHPGFFRQNGQARVDIFVTDGANNARRVYSDTLLAYRLLAGRPVKVQIARKGALCGAGSTASTQCAAQLAWNGQTFGESASVNSERANAVAPAITPATPPSSASASSSATPARLVVPANAEAGFLAQCRKDYVSRDAGAARWADGQCKEDWRFVVASGPAADVLLAVAPSPGERPSLDLIKQRAAGVRWGTRAHPPFIAVGSLGGLSASVEGKGMPTAVGFNWTEIGAQIPYDVVNAMRVRGVTLTQMSCEKTGVGEGNRVYAGTAPGRAPFKINIDQRTAPTGNATSYYGVSISLDGRHPPRGSTAGCDF